MWHFLDAFQYPSLEIAFEVTVWINFPVISHVAFRKKVKTMARAGYDTQKSSLYSLLISSLYSLLSSLYSLLSSLYSLLFTHLTSFSCCYIFCFLLCSTSTSFQSMPQTYIEREGERIRRRRGASRNYGFTWLHTTTVETFICGYFTWIVY